jgi:molybdopterin converting factor small subunit
MKIHVVLAGPLSKYGNGSRHQIVEVDDACQMKDIIVALGITENKYSFAMINGIKNSEETVLQNGDEVKIYPVVSGG